MGITKEKVLKVMKFIFPVCLLIFAITEMKKFTGNINVGLLKNEIGQLHFLQILIIFGITFAAVLPMVFYDVILAKILKIKVSRRELTEQSFIANSFSNLIGFGGLVGAMLRTYFFHKFEQDKRKLLGVIATVSLFYLTGISFLSWIVTIHYSNYPLYLHTRWLYFAVLGVGLYLPIFLTIHVFQTSKDKNHIGMLKTMIQLVMVSVIEWFAVFASIFILTIILGFHISFFDLFPVYIGAACAGIISMIPGGLGSFDLVFLWGMQDLHYPEEKVLVLLLFYRIGYYFIPFLVSLVFFVRLYWQRWNQLWNNLPKAIVQGISHIILTVLVFLSGLILLLSASVPGIMSRLRIAQELLSFPIINVSHQLSVAAGFLLLGLSRGIEYSVKRTYDLTMLALILAALFSIFKGIDYEEASFLIIVALLLRTAKGQFYRESYVLTWGKTIFDVTIILIVTLMYIIIGYFNLPHARITIPKRLLPYVIVDYRDLFSSAIIGLIIAFSILFIGYLISRPKKWKLERSIDHEQDIMKHLSVYEGNVSSHLIFLHDKYIFWNKKKNVLISFQKYADKLIVLGDPIGDNQGFSSAIEEFQEIADLHGFTPVFYQVSDRLLPYLHGHGFAFFKLGEEAFIDLRVFQIEEKKSDFTEWKSQFVTQHYSSEILYPPYSNELIEEIRLISDDWLQGRNEKGFSLGFFDENYLNKAPIAIVRDEKGSIIGFMSIMYVYDNFKTVSVDLIRVKPSVQNSVIDFLFLTSFDWAIEKGYQRFNMGMAPLSNVGLSRFSFLSEKIAAQIFLHGHFIDYFPDIRKFNEKYTYLWEPKYLAYRRKSSLPFVMAQITLLISKKRA
ncbi:bifunctional lysylphosphatidylglycerol flippase/synthetase MprF [Neobacillus cucumis]|uniref:bifunctional lysylphosphatidylglycerol flippase/synthetase MprF n=1 Tax=Neobacillus cucumis TaxID=1740721 RepID=UPI001EF76556|nr:bifunctional lysylphosphatidylglycerol flippase/synthetase MprF [Neobacillus cucumis]MBM7655090.1 phosphatidylglycerol lysyltransferase [Neobacillus cucumis]